MESPDNVDILWVSSDPLDSVFGRIMVSSLVLHVVGGPGLSRDVSFARRFPFQDVGEYTQTCAHGAGAPNVASAKHSSVNSSSFDLVPPEFGNLRAGSKTHMADATSRLEVTADVALVGEFLGGAVGHDDEGNDEARKGRRGQAPRPPQGRRQRRGSTARPNTP